MNIYTYRNLELNKKLKDRKKALILNFKQSGCNKCKIDNPLVLEFDHINPSNKYIAVSEMVTNHNYSLFDIKTEIEKCQILCTNCHRIKSKLESDKFQGKAKHRAEKRDFINKYKDKPCIDCSQSYPAECMDLDHLPTFKKNFTVGMSKSYSKEKLINEMNKCEVVCANCHKLRTHERRTVYGLKGVRITLP